MNKKYIIVIVFVLVCLILCFKIYSETEAIKKDMEENAVNLIIDAKKTFVYVTEGGDIYSYG